MSVAVVFKIWVGWFSSPAILHFIHITASQPQQASDFEAEASQDILKQVWGKNNDFEEFASPQLPFGVQEIL